MLICTGLVSFVARALLEISKISVFMEGWVRCPDDVVELEVASDVTGGDAGRGGGEIRGDGGREVAGGVAGHEGGGGEALSE